MLEEFRILQCRHPPLIVVFSFSADLSVLRSSVVLGPISILDSMKLSISFGVRFNLTLRLLDRLQNHFDSFAPMDSQQIDSVDPPTCLRKIWVQEEVFYKAQKILISESPQDYPEVQLFMPMNN